MDLKNYESFVLTAQRSSFTKAAEALGCSQSTVSFQIRQLEESLGVPLFERIGHTVKLTPKGSEILVLAQQMLALSGQIETTARDTVKRGGLVRIAMAESLSHWLFWDHFGPFHRQFPEVELRVFNGGTEELFRLLRTNEVDLVYTLDRHIYDPAYVIASERPANAHFIAAAGHPFCSRRGLKLQDLVGQPFILTEGGMSYRTILQENLARQSLQIHPFLEIGDPALICRLVGQGMGLSFLPDYTTERSEAEGTLCRLEVEDCPSDLWIQLLYHHDKWCTPEMQSVIDYLGIQGGRLESEPAR